MSASKNRRSLAFEIGFVWVCIGFVFRESEGVIIFIILCVIEVYVHFGFS